jgi:CzcA family heavy metal efflux pump
VLDRVIELSLRNRPLVLIAALVMLCTGLYQLARTPVDVFPDLNRPTVTVMTEAPGLAPEEVETLVTRPIEYALNGATGVRRVRSASGVGLSIVCIEFSWDTDIYRDRQVVSERLQVVRSRLPRDSEPVMAPISSIMGEVMLVGLRPAAEPRSPEEALERGLELRTYAEFTVRNRLLAIEGVSQVSVMGGHLKQYQIITTPARLAGQNVTLEQLTAAAEKANALAGGGILERGAREALIRISGQSLTPEQIAEVPVVWRDGRAIRIREVAEVRFGGPVRRGEGSTRVREDGRVSGGASVVVAIQKQPQANTLDLTPHIDSALDQLEHDAPPGTVIERRVFRQADFIRTAIDNVIEAIRDGTIWVFVILLLFLASIRTSLITLTAIPLSVLVTVLVFACFGVTINTMTLGGLAVAVGELVDDAVVDVENIFRRLRENRVRSSPDPALAVIFRASSEVRNSIVYATLIVCLMVLPLFALAGLEGRMFAPLGLAYLVSLLASLVISLTVTPVLSSYLLGRARSIARPRDPLVLRGLKSLDTRLLRFSLRRPWPVLVAAMFLSAVTMLAVIGMGSEFLPPFNEGTVTVNLQAPPGTSLAESSRVAGRAEESLLRIPEVVSVSRRTGRAEQDEHAEGVSVSELDVRIAPHERPKTGVHFAILRAVPGLRRFGVETTGRHPEAVLADIRERMSGIPNVRANVGQPISHRLDHVMSGVRAQIAVKVFGPDLQELRAAAYEIEAAMSAVSGVVDLQVEPQVEIPQVRLRVKREEAARYGLTPGDVARLLETAYRGRVVSTILDGEKFFQLVVWYDEAARNSPGVIGQTILDTPSGKRVPLSQVAEVLETTGPNTLNHEDVARRIVVSCNVQGRSLGDVVEDVRRSVAAVEERLRAKGADYRIEDDGQYRAQREANARLLVLGLAAVAGVFLLLWRCLGSWRAALMVLGVNIPLAGLGAVAALLITNRPDASALQAAPWWRWPQLWAGATTLSVAHWVGFITLIGIVSRNGIMMIAHYIHLMREEGEAFGEAMIVRGSLERLAPVLMTAAVTAIGLLPLALGGGQPGKEILHPLAIVVVGGLITSTLLDQMVTPSVFLLFGRNVYVPASSERAAPQQEPLPGQVS